MQKMHDQEAIGVQIAIAPYELLIISQKKSILSYWYGRKYINCKRASL